MYTVKFQYMIGDKVYDTVTGRIMTVLGIFYGNGKTIFSDKPLFHSITYHVDAPLEEFPIRKEEQLKKVIKYEKN